MCKAGAAMEPLATRLDKLCADLEATTCAEIQQALDVINEAFDRYEFGQLALSFNGGKDCTVVFHLIRLVIQNRFCGETDKDKTISSFRMVYFSKKDEFQEVKDFVEEMKTKYGFTLEILPGDFKVGLQMLKDQGVEAVFLGQRRSDPHAGDLEHFSPCTEGWPAICRVNPILEWRMTTVWRFLKGLDLEYCSLYNEGYASLGCTKTTKKHPELEKHSRPAYELPDEYDERVGRQ